MIIKQTGGNTAMVLINRTIGNGPGEISAKQYNDEYSDLSHDCEINFMFDSNGGSVEEGKQIYKAIRGYSGQTTAHIQGLCASIASVIALGCDQVFMAADSLLMIHDPFYSVSRAESRCSMPGHNYIKIPRLQKLIEIPTLTKNNSRHSIEMMRRSVNKHRNTSAERRRLLEADREFILNAYFLRSGSCRSELAEMMQAETWFTASDAVRFGFADYVTAPAGLIDHHDLAQFSNPTNFLAAKYMDSATTARAKRQSKVNRKQVSHMRATVQKIITQRQHENTL